MEDKEKEFAQIVREHKRRIYTVCYMFSKDADEVADLFQEILINMWKGFSSFRGESSISTWIWRISLNTCINTSKKSRKLDTVPLNVNINPYEDIGEDALQMRQQFAVLRDRFDRQEIVTDRLLRQTQQRRMNIYDWINMYIPITVLVIMLPMLYLCHKSYGLPLWVAISAVIFALISVAVHSRERRRYSKTFNFEGDVLQIAECVRDFRKRQCKITAVGAVVSILFLVVGYSA